MILGAAGIVLGAAGCCRVCFLVVLGDTGLLLGDAG